LKSFLRSDASTSKHTHSRIGNRATNERATLLNSKELFKLIPHSAAAAAAECEASAIKASRKKNGNQGSLRHSLTFSPLISPSGWHTRSLVVSVCLPAIAALISSSNYRLINKKKSF
jgi:hypothetical protein